MPKRGENIYKRKDSRWEGRYVRSRTPEGKPCYGYVYARTYREVKEKLKEALKNKPRTVPQTVNFATYCNKWLQQSSVAVKESTYVKYRSTVNKHIIPFFGYMKPGDIDSDRIADFIRCKLDEGLSPKTVRDTVTVFNSVVKYCQREDVYVPHYTVVYPKEHREEMKILTPKEQISFVKYLQKDMDSVKFGTLLALLTGMRIGEICALQWKHISSTEGTVSVYSTMQRLADVREGVGTRIVIDDAKTKTSNRIIPINSFTSELCEKMKVDDKEAYVLTGKRKFMEPRTLQNKLKRYTEDCGLEGVHFHTLRHTFATRCVEVGFDIKTLSEILGHANSKITLDRYVHPSMELKRKQMEKLASFNA